MRVKDRRVKVQIESRLLPGQSLWNLKIMRTLFHFWFKQIPWVAAYGTRKFKLLILT